MLMALFQLMLRILLACVKLGLQLVVALGRLVGVILYHLVSLLWRLLTTRRGTRIAMRAPDVSAPPPPLPEPPASHPPASHSAFTPRQLRPRPRR